MASTQSITSTLASATAAFKSGGLTYPTDVGTMSRMEHYVQFFINEQVGANASFRVGAYSSGGNTERLPGTMERAPTQRTLGSICLYMPAQIQVSQKANYGEAEIGLVVAGALKAGVSLGKAIDGKDAFDLGSFAKTVAGESANTLSATLEGAGATGAKAALAIKSGQTTNNRTEMKFEGIDRRSFSFSFRLIPRSADEARRIESIVTMFRLHSMPEFAGYDGLGRTLKAPSTFDIEYHPAEHLHKIGTSVLEGVDVKFGGERPQFYVDNQPSETELTLTFKELEIVTKEKIAKGY